MAIRTPDRIVKITCMNCGWYLVLNHGGVGDCLTGNMALRLSSNIFNELCPICKHTQFIEFPASCWERVSPIEYCRKLYWTVFH